jgi:glycosyltransferase involved in cell wall biosynthesis
MRVCIVPEYPMSLMTGGLQVQAVEMCKALSLLDPGMTAELLEWSNAGAPCDLYHFIGFPNHMHRIIELVRQAGRPDVITMLFGSPQSSNRVRIMAVRRLISSRLLGKKGRDEAIRHAAAIVTITESDATAAHTIFGIEKTRIEVVPHGVAEDFFKCTPTVWRNAHGNSEFVLCVGAVQARKNQLLLAQVCNHLKLPLVLVGPVLPGQTEYARLVREAMRENESFGGRWCQELQNEDALMHSAYGACRVFALLSTEETQPISVLQAMAARKPVLLLEADYARDELFRQLPRVQTGEFSAAVDALKMVWENGKPTELSLDHSWRSIARRLQTIYDRVLVSNR